MESDQKKTFDCSEIILSFTGSLVDLQYYQLAEKIADIVYVKFCSETYSGCLKYPRTSQIVTNSYGQAAELNS